VAKRLYQFLIIETLSLFQLQFRQWIGSGGDFDHSPVWLTLNNGPKKSVSHLKFNANWLKEDSFKKLVKDS
jgi:hypothetical protein